MNRVLQQLLEYSLENWGHKSPVQFKDFGELLSFRIWFSTDLSLQFIWTITQLLVKTKCTGLDNYFFCVSLNNDFLDGDFLCVTLNNDSSHIGDVFWDNLLLTERRTGLDSYFFCVSLNNDFLDGDFLCVTLNNRRTTAFSDQQQMKQHM